MIVSGSYLAFQLRGSLPFFRIYQDSILTDALAGFVNLEQRAGSVADAAFKRLGSRPAADDSGDMEREAEWAREEGQAYYEAMTGLRQATINLLAAGLFHLLEQQLARLTFDRKFRDICVDPMKANLGRSGRLLSWYKKHFGLDLEALPQWETINQMRLVAGAVKHADGDSARELRGKREELFRKPAVERMNLATPDYDRWPLRSPLTGEDLFVTEEVFAGYAQAVHDFMAAIVAYFQRNADKDYPCG